MTKQSDIEMVAKARAWAVKAHAGQKDKAGQDCFKAHVTVVAEGVKGDPIAEAVAFLHDTVEDTSVTIEDIRTGFPKEVADAVSTLTHSKGISYAEYLWYVQQNSIVVKSLSNKCSDILEDILHHARELPEKDAPYKYSIGLDTLSWKVVADALDTYSRILMGQFGVIYEALDISGNDEQHFQAYHDARWNGVGVLEARDLLIPQLKKIRLGWNGNFGISNSGLAYNSKLAYEILKTIRYATEKRDSSVLKVTKEPLPHVDGSFQIKAL